MGRSGPLRERMMMEHKKVIFCTPTPTRPFDPFLASMEASIPLIIAAGWEEGSAYKVGSPYISHARAEMTRQALDAQADVIVYLDHDLSWAPQDLLALIETDGDVVAGTYRFRKTDEAYMATLHTDVNGRPLVRTDGCMKADKVPAGFLKITKDAIHRFMEAYPELIYGPRYHPSIDLFNHGAYQGVWYGEDYGFSRRWGAMGEDIWIVPNLDITHHNPDQAFPGNFHQFMMRQPGGVHAGQ